MEKLIEHGDLAKNRNTTEIRVRRVSKMMKQDIDNIASHVGISVNDYLKMNLLTIIASAPPHYRQPM